ncbi:MAG: leucyl aminopeptidase family protein [Deltaproteobacteria bacterium]|nr:leucyl aminopeptidase family protein [Deltaproteobacteria bacterium]
MQLPVRLEKKISKEKKREIFVVIGAGIDQVSSYVKRDFSDLKDKLIEPKEGVTPLYLSNSKSLISVVLNSNASKRDQMESGAQLYKLISDLITSDTLLRFCGDKSFFYIVLEGLTRGAYKFKSSFDQVLKEYSKISLMDVDWEVNLKEFFSYLYWLTYYRWLVDLPSNICTPDFLSEEARRVSSKLGLSCKILGKSELEKKGFGGIIAVSGDQNAYVIELSYSPKINRSKKWDLADHSLCLLGKGVTFDTGGICLKPPEGMSAMKADMSAAALILSLLCLASDVQIKIPLTGLIGTTCNCISRNSVKPGDVIRIKNGQLVQVENTDAEGRLILADLISFCGEQNYKNIITLATLTGGIRVGLGLFHAGFFSTDKKFANLILEAGELSGDFCCLFPFEQKYAKELEVSKEIISNIGTSKSGAPVLAAMFLKHFTKPDMTFIHFDIAGVAYHTGELVKHWGKGATGFGFKLFYEIFKRLEDTQI